MAQYGVLSYSSLLICMFFARKFSFSKEAEGVPAHVGTGFGAEVGALLEKGEEVLAILKEDRVFEHGLPVARTSKVYFENLPDAGLRAVGHHDDPVGHIDGFIDKENFRAKNMQIRRLE